MNDISVGGHVGRYEIKSELGEGGMGKVYRGYDPKLNRPVAIKTLSDDMAKDPDSVKRFLREARAAACLPDDPHIVKVYDINQLNGNGRPYIVMEYVEGKTFSSYISRNVLPDSATVDWRLDKFRQILEAVNYAHKNGVVHRDLKPGNVMISDSGLAKVMDSGIDGLGMGTPSYGAPEQLSGKSPTDERTDIYSLGVILYELLTGQIPFTGGIVWEVINKVITEPAPSVRSCNPNISSALSDVVARCLEKDPDKRFQSVGELIESFDKAYYKEKTAPTLAEVAPVPQSKNSGLTSGLFGGLLGVFLAFILFYVLFNPNKANVSPPESVTTPSYSQSSNTYVAESEVSLPEPVATPSYSQSSNTYIAETEPVVAAPEPAVTPDPSQALRDRYANLPVGEYFEFGNYPQGANDEIKPIRWRILKRDSDSILVISKYCLDCKHYNEENKEITWENCTLRHWLNDDFYNKAFDSQEQSLIKTSYLTNDANPSTSDRIFLLSIGEINEFFADQDDRCCKPTEYDVKNGALYRDDNDSEYIAYKDNAWWWLRSRGYDNCSASYVNGSGNIYGNGNFVNNSNVSVRPALRLAL